MSIGKPDGHGCPDAKCAVISLFFSQSAPSGDLSAKRPWRSSETSHWLWNHVAVVDCHWSKAKSDLCMGSPLLEVIKCDDHLLERLLWFLVRQHRHSRDQPLNFYEAALEFFEPRHAGFERWRPCFATCVGSDERPLLCHEACDLLKCRCGSWEDCVAFVLRQHREGHWCRVSSGRLLSGSQSQHDSRVRANVHVTLMMLRWSWGGVGWGGMLMFMWRSWCYVDLCWWCSCMVQSCESFESSLFSSESSA